MKKFISIFIILCLIAGIFPVAFAETDTITQIGNSETCKVSPLSYYNKHASARVSGSALILPNNTYATYEVKVLKAGVYSMSAKVITFEIGAAFTVSINSVMQNEAELGNTADKQQTTTPFVGKYSLSEGTYYITLRSKAPKAIYLYELNFEETDDAYINTQYLSSSAAIAENNIEANPSDKFILNAKCTFTVEENSFYKVYLSVATDKDGIFANISSEGRMLFENVLVENGGWAEFKKLYVGKVKLTETENTIEIVSKGLMRLGGITLEKLLPPTGENEKEFLDEINSAEDTLKIKEILQKSSNLPIEQNFDELFYPQEVYASLIGKEFASFEEFSLMLKTEYDTVETSPCVALYIDGVRQNKFKSGDVTIKISPKIKNGTTFLAALYKAGRLYALDMKKVTGTEGTTLNLGEINADQVSFKLIILNNTENINPLDFYSVLEQKSNKVYISQNGNDITGDGTIQAPFATITKAKEYVSENYENMESDIEVNILSGEYFVDKPITFTKDDSGKNGFDIVYKGVGETKPLISGGVKVTGYWEQYTDGIYMTYVPDADEARQMYINGFAAQRAQSKGYYIASEKYSEDGSIYSEDGFIVLGGGIPEFSKPEQMEAVYHILWANQRVPVKDMFRKDGNTTVVMDQPAYNSYVTAICAGGIQPVIGSRFHFENALELLDEEGEFYFDTDTHILYYYPFAEENLESAEIYIPKSEGIIEISGSSLNDKVKNLRFENLDIRHGAYNEVSKNGFATFQADCLIEYDKAKTNAAATGKSVMSQIKIENAENISISNCDIKNHGSAAIGMYEGVINSTLERNVISDISATGIIIGSWRESTAADKDKLCENITIKNNVITRAGIEFMGSVGLGIYYAKNISVTNNHISDLPYTGITLGWGWSNSTPIMKYAGGHLISENIIENVSKEEQDGGHIYSLGNLNNTIISKNYLSGSDDFGGIYFDTGTSNVVCEENVVDSCDMYWLFRNNPTSGYGITIGVNYVDEDNSSNNFIGDSYEEQGNSYAAPVVYSAENWEGEALLVFNKAGIEKECIDFINASEYPTWRKTAYDFVPHIEQTTENEYVIEAEDYVDSYSSNPNSPFILYTKGNGRTVIGNFQINSWCSYKVNAKKAGTYSVELRYTTGPTASAAEEKVIIWVDQVAYINNAVLPDTLCSWNVYPGKIIGTVELKEGENEIVLKNAYYAWSFDNFKLTLVE